MFLELRVELVKKVNPAMSEQDEQKVMHRRRITLADGRYLIFYTFDELPAPRAETQGDSASKREPAPKPEAEEERRV